MNQPNPWILLMGGLALFNVAAMAYGLKIPEWARIVLALGCIALGLVCIVIAFRRHYAKKPVPPPKPVRRSERRRDMPPPSDLPL